MSDLVYSHAGVIVAVSQLPQDTDLDRIGFGALTYDIIGNVGALGEYGINTNMLTYDTTDTTVTRKSKGITDAGTPSIEVARDDNDPGQQAMDGYAAPGYIRAHAFQIVKQDGAVDFLRGLVAGPNRTSGRNEDFDTNSYVVGLLQQPLHVDGGPGIFDTGVVAADGTVQPYEVVPNT